MKRSATEWLLLRARANLRKGLARNAFARRADGTSCGAYGCGAVEWSAMGAMWEALCARFDGKRKDPERIRQVMDEACAAVDAVLPLRGDEHVSMRLETWSNKSTQKQVVKLFTRALEQFK